MLPFYVTIAYEICYYLFLFTIYFGETHIQVSSKEIKIFDDGEIHLVV